MACKSCGRTGMKGIYKKSNSASGAGAAGTWSRPDKSGSSIPRSVTGIKTHRPNKTSTGKRK